MYNIDDEKKILEKFELHLVGLEAMYGNAVNVALKSHKIYEQNRNVRLEGFTNGNTEIRQ